MEEQFFYTIFFEQTSVSLSTPNANRICCKIWNFNIRILNSNLFGIFAMNMNTQQKKISIVIPVYNESENIGELYKQIVATLLRVEYPFEFVFVDDGSTDQSLKIIKALAEMDSRVFYVELSRNFGHQYALKAGLDLASGDCAISMDSDLQHPPQIIIDLLKKWEEGFDIVYTKRNEDANLSWFKRRTSAFFYVILNQLSDLKLEQGTADFRLMSRVALNAFSGFNENELFIRGLIKWSGFKQTAISYDPQDRFGGSSKYDLKKMLSFAIKGITSFSTRPLKMVAVIGLVLFFISLILVPYAVISFLMKSAVSGWTSLMITIIFFGSLQLLMLGVIALYLGKIVIQSKHRPLYFIRETNYPRN
jgi:dolichol-phosphate mannosyltransferase